MIHASISVDVVSLRELSSHALSLCTVPIHPGVGNLIMACFVDAILHKRASLVLPKMALCVDFPEQLEMKHVFFLWQAILPNIQANLFVP